MYEFNIRKLEIIHFPYRSIVFTLAHFNFYPCLKGVFHFQLTILNSSFSVFYLLYLIQFKSNLALEKLVKLKTKNLKHLIMNYTIKGRLHAVICDEKELVVASTVVRLYALNEEVNAATAMTAAQSKEVAQVFEEKEIKKRKNRLLAETVTDEKGNYEFAFDCNDESYSGGAVGVSVYYKEVPNYGQNNTDLPRRFQPFEVLLDVFQPKWREDENGLVATWNYQILRRIWCYILMRLDIWVICGTLLNCESQLPIKGIEVIAMDDDFITDDRLGSAITNDKGEFCIFYRSLDFKKTFLSPFINVETSNPFSFDNGPDVYFKYAIGGSEFFSESPSEAQNINRKNVDNCLCVTLCLDKEGQTPGIPVAFYEIGYARNYHPILNIDPATGKTVGMVNPSHDNQAFFSTIELRGSLNQEFNGQPTEYKFQYVNVANSSITIGSIAETDWNDVLPEDISKTKIAARIFDGVLNKEHSYYIKGSGLTDSDGRIEFDVPFDGNWIQVPQFVPGPTEFALNFTNALIKLKSGNLKVKATGLPNAKIVDKSALTPGDSSGPLEENNYFILRMLKREQGDDSTIAVAGFSRALAIFNTRYGDVEQGGSWFPAGKSTEFGIACLDLQELASGGCSKITDSLTVDYTAANPNLGKVSIKLNGPGGTVDFGAIPYSTPNEEAHGTISYPGVVSDLPNCAFEVRIDADLNLTNGETQHQGVWDRVLFCKSPATP